MYILSSVTDVWLISECETVKSEFSNPPGKKCEFVNVKNVSV